MITPVRVAIILLVAGLILIFDGCTYNRNAPILNIEDSANGNTVPVSAVP
jgi:PBP1b-binding outer membrane lipoprotein LpoB